ncbi:MAG: murein biosynthesis integral membrane protein MurJ [Thermodesulfobacteriota bacterium]
MNTSTNRHITGAASIVGSATLLSRVFGYIRDAVIAAMFGAGFHTDIFFVAFRIPNFFRRLVGEGALAASLVPVFTEEITTGTEERGKELASKIFTIFSIIFLILTVLGIVFSGHLVRILAPGFATTENKLILTISMTRWMFPFLFFIGLMAVAMGILNSMRHFMAPALSPVLFNIAIIVSAIYLSAYFVDPIYALAVGVVLGGLLQFLLQLPYLKKFGFLPRPCIDLNDPAVRRVLYLMGPYALGVAVYQINIFVTQGFASSLVDGSISYLYYANRLVELPLGVFGMAVATAVLPSMSEHAAKGEWNLFRDSFSFAIRIVNFITIPSMVGLLVLGLPIISVLFQRGEFDQEATKSTAYALYFYSLGLVAFTGTRITASAFYSLKDTVTPVLAAISSVVANLVLCFLLIEPLKHGGLALATSMAAFLNFIILFVALRMRMGRIGGMEIVRSAVKVSIASIIMGIGVYCVNIFISRYGGGGLWNIVTLVTSLCVGVAIFLLSAHLLRVCELNFIVKILAERFQRSSRNNDVNE